MVDTRTRKSVGEEKEKMPGCFVPLLQAAVRVLGIYPDTDIALRQTRFTHLHF